jgi:PPP family 3-phenylpropionic acid transporter
MARTLSAFGLLSFTYFAAIGLFSPYAPLWFKEMGLSTFAIGAIASLQSWTRIVAPYAWSWAGDHSGRRVELIRLAALGTVLAAFGLLGVGSATAVAVVTALLFIANSGVVPLYEAVLANLLRTDQGIDTARYGRVRVWGSVGFLVSVVACGVLLQGLGIQAFPWMVAAVNATMLAAALRLPSTRAEARHDEPAPPVLPRLRDPMVAWFFASIFFTVLAHTCQYAFFSLYLDRLGYGKAAVGMLWALGVVAEIAFFWLQGRWLGRWSPHRWLLVVALFTAARFAATAAGGFIPALLVLAQLTHAITFAAHHASCVALISRFFPDRLRGRGQALYTTLGYGLPGLIGGIGGGWLVELGGFVLLFLVASLSGLLAFACAWRSAHPSA